MSLESLQKVCISYLNGFTDFWAPHEVRTVKVQF